MPRRRPYDRFAVDALIAQRDGVVRSSELRRLGMGASTITHRCRAGGPWQRLLPGIILVSNGSATLSQQIRAALLYGGGGALLTGGAALRRRGVRQMLDGQRLHILIPHRRHRVSTGFVVVERTTRLPNHRNVEGVPCAPIARAAIDATRRSRSVSDVRAAISEVVQRNLCSVAELGLEIRDAQIRGTALPRRVLREVSEGARSVAEAEVRDFVLRAGLPAAKWNHDVFTVDGQWLACTDAIWEEYGVVLEVDSLEWHLSPASYRKTQARHRRLTAAGLLVVHVTPGTVRSNPSAFIAELSATLATAARRMAPAIIVRTSGAA